MRQTGLQHVCCVPRCALRATPACLRHPSSRSQACVALWYPTALVGLRLALARPVWGPSASNTWRPGSRALASSHGSGSRGHGPRGEPPLGLLQGPARRRGSRWLGPGRPATQAGPRCSRSLGDRRLGLSRACALGPVGRASEAGPVAQGLGLAGAWRPRPAHLLGDPGLQLPADVAPGHAVQVLQLAQQQQGPALGVRVPGAGLELQPHVRHLPPPRPRPGRPAPCALLRPGSAPPRPARPRRPAFPAASGPRRPAEPTRGARGRRRRRGAGRTAPSGPPLGASGARAPGSAPALAAALARVAVGS